MRLGGLKDLHTAEGSMHTVRKKKICLLFFSYEGLSWHLRALHCKFQMYKDRCCRETHRIVPTTVQESSLNIGGAEPPSASIGGAIAP